MSALPAVPQDTTTRPGWGRTVALPIALALCAIVALAAVMLITRSSADRQVNFVSHEPELGLPGGRLIFYPGRSEMLLKAWGLDNLPEGETYEVWALDNVTGPRLLASLNSGIIQEIDLFLHTELIRVKEVLVTRPKAPDDPALRGPTVISMTR